MQVSVIIPCHNCFDTIQRAVDSVFSQTYKDWELILVNNNSKDNTWNKLIEIKEQNPDKLIKILDEKKKGAPAARNKGLYEANGNWIQFLDADDEILSEKIDKQLRLYENSDLIIGGAILQKANGRREHKILQREQWKGLIRSELGITSANLFRKEMLLKIKGWDESLSSSQEYNLMFRMLKNDAVCSFVDDYDTIIYESDNSISRDQSAEKTEKIVKNRLELRFSILEYLKTKKILNKEYKKAIKDSVMNNLLYYGNTIPLFSWQIFLKKIFVLNPNVKDFKHLIMITLFYKK